jgi:hypothetical protein
MLKEKIWANFQRIIELFTPKIVTKLSKIWIWDPGSEIRKKPIPDPGSWGQKGTGSRIRIHNTAGMFIPDPVSGIFFHPQTESGYRGQKGTGSGILNSKQYVENYYY